MVRRNIEYRAECHPRVSIVLQLNSSMDVHFVGVSKNHRQSQGTLFAPTSDRDCPSFLQHTAEALKLMIYPLQNVIFEA